MDSRRVSLARGIAIQQSIDVAASPEPKRRCKSFRGSSVCQDTEVLSVTEMEGLAMPQASSVRRG